MESSSAEKSDGEREEILDRMLTRLALTDDSKLEPLLVKLLPYTISSLSSSSVLVRKKVMEILTHVNKRVKHQFEITLPLSELWKIYMEATATPMVKNFCIVYIEMAFERLKESDQALKAPELLAKISTFPSQHQDIILRLVIKVIGEHHSHQIHGNVIEAYGLIENVRDRKLFVEFCLHMILYQPLAQSESFPAGLSIAQKDRITGKKVLTSDMLLKRKLGILNVMEIMDLSPELVYPLYVAACCDSQESVVKRGEELLRKKASNVNLEDLELINKLFFLFNGTTGAENIPLESRVNPGNLTLRVRLMFIFCRSITAANAFPSTLQCIFGCIFGNNSSTKLRQLGTEFTVWVFKHATVDQLKVMGPVVLSGLLRSLDTNTNLESETFAKGIKSFAFQAVGLLSQRMPQLFRDKIDMAVRLFNALKSEPQTIRLTIQDAMNSLAVVYKGSPTHVLKELETLLLEHSQVEQNEVRFCAVQWATSLFELQHPPSRFICMIAASDPMLDIREMALEGLFPKDDHEQPREKTSYPALNDMLDFICMQQPELLTVSEIRKELIFPLKMYVAMLRFLLKSYEEDLEKDVSVCETSKFQSSVMTLCLLFEHAMVSEGSIELHAISSMGLVTIASHMPDLIASRYAGRISWLKQFLSHIDNDTRRSFSRLLGIASSTLSAIDISSLLNELISSIRERGQLRFEGLYGALCALGYVTAEYVRVHAISEELLQSTITCLVEIVKVEIPSLSAIAMEAMGHIGLRCPLPMMSSSSISCEGVLSILHERLEKLLSGDDVKVIQKIAIALGHISINETSYPLLDVTLNLIFSLSRSKVEDLLFAGGEALSFIWGGIPVTADVILKTNYTSLSLASNYLAKGMPLSVGRQAISERNVYEEEFHDMARSVIIKKLFDVLLFSSRKEERCAGTVWLLSLTMYCGHHPKIQKLLPQIQEAFLYLLGDQHELTQELASQGMSVVYELGDSVMKKDLVNTLVSTLTGSGKRKRAVKLMGDSEVFKEGALGESLSGGKLSTYKELCGLANEMGKPDLIYKFMDLANYQASLNSKRGAAFGFSKIAKQAGDALQAHMINLIPKLVRYQYDPDKNVQDAMGHIWKFLVSDPKKAIDDNLDTVIEDLLSHCGSRLWRSREAACLALADVIHGRKFNQVSRHLKEIWIAAFRAMDDIKETVRNSGEKLCQAVSLLTTRLCDISLSTVSDSKKAMDVVLPFLLTEGIMSKVSNIQKVSISLVVKLAKGAGIALRLYLSDLVCCMLESLSSLEDQRLNYIELHAANSGTHMEKLENIRIALAKDSPMWETLDLCINAVDAQSLETLIPRLSQLVRSGVGLNTRAGVANFISLLIQKVGLEIKPFTGILLKILFPASREEKSLSVKRAFAASCASALKYATLPQIQNLIEDTATLHLGDKNKQITCAILLKNYYYMAADILSGYNATLLPVTFISSFEDDKDVADLFRELWEENVSSEKVTLQLYLPEITSLICEGILSSSWANKKKSAKATMKLLEVLDESVSPYHQGLLNCLLKEIPGRLWEGKEIILHATSSLCTSCHRAISSIDPAIPESILTIISSACTKKAKAYREAAFTSLLQVIKAFGRPEFFKSVFPMLYDSASQMDTSKSRNAFLSDNIKTGKDTTEEYFVPLDKIIDCITACINVAHQIDILEQRKKLVHVYLSAFSPGLSWPVKISVFSSVKMVCSKLNPSMKLPKMGPQSDESLLLHELFDHLAPKALECLGSIKIAQVHIAASDCLLELFQTYKNISLSETKDEGHLLNGLIHFIELEKNEEAKSTLKKCINILKEMRSENPSTVV